MTGGNEVEIIPDTTGLTLFVCSNCARPAKETTSTARTRPSVPDLRLPGRFQQIIVPCAGRLQPEHVLKAFENGSSVVSVIACREDNCHYIEGSRRCSLRMDYIRSILNEIGLGEERLLYFLLPGSAKEDLALAVGDPASGTDIGDLEAQVSTIRTRIIEALQILFPNPLQQPIPGARAGNLSGTNSAFDEDPIDE